MKNQKSILRFCLSTGLYLPVRMGSSLSPNLLFSLAFTFVLSIGFSLGFAIPALANISHSVCEKNKFQNKIQVTSLGLEYTDVELKCESLNDKSLLVLQFLNQTNENSNQSSNENTKISSKNKLKKQKAAEVATTISFDCKCNNENEINILDLSKVLLDSKKITESSYENTNGLLLQFRSASDAMLVQNRILGPDKKKFKELWAKDFSTQGILSETSMEFEIINDFENNEHKLIYHEYLTYSDQTDSAEDLKNLTEEDLAEDDYVQVHLQYDSKSGKILSSTKDSSFLIFMDEADDKLSLVAEKVKLIKSESCSEDRLVILNSAKYGLKTKKMYSLGYIFRDKETALEAKTKNKKCPGLKDKDIIKLATQPIESI